MAGNRTKLSRQAIFNSQLTATLSISLVLFMLGIMGILLFTGQRISERVKENIGFSLILKSDASDTEIQKLVKYIDATNYARSVKFITREDAAKELASQLGEDFVEFIGYNPLLSSVEVKLKADFADAVNIERIKEEYTDNSIVKEFSYQKDLVSMVNTNIRKIAVWISGFSLLLLLISIALINNTIRLLIYSKRFLINTMKLVGATPGFIRRPFIQRGILTGLTGGLLAIVMICGLLFGIEDEVKDIISFNDVEMLGIISAGILLVGMLLSHISSYFAVNKYVKLRSHELYF